MQKKIKSLVDIKLTTNQLILLVCSYIAFILNIPFLIKATQAITRLDQFNVLFLLSVPLFLLSLSVLIQCFFAFRKITKPTLIILVLLSSVVFYASLNYGIIFDYGMIESITDNSATEVLSYMSYSTLIFLLVFGIIPSIFIFNVKLSYSTFSGELFARLKLLLGSFSVLLFIALVFYSNYASVGRNNGDLIGYLTPYALLDSSAKYLQRNVLYPPPHFELIDTKPKMSNDEERVTVLVLGQTARAQNFSLNGYEKQTNLYTKNWNVISFTNMTSCGTSKAVSIPCIFSNLDRQNFNKRVANAKQNVLDIIQLAGVNVLWIANDNTSCKGVCKRIKRHKITQSDYPKLCQENRCYDEAIIKQLDQKLANITHSNTLIILHIAGSRGPDYFTKYPSGHRYFIPDCQRSDIQNCTSEELVNAYDNSIAYTDFVLAQIIERLEKLSINSRIETALLYTSDHGESLGEKGIYLHGIPYVFAPKEQLHIPLIVKIFGNNTNTKCVKEAENLPVSHDNVFDLLLGLTGVRSTTYNADKDILSQCRFSDNFQ
ncbi:phosphoethanolamine transferase [Planctobacterium marinum]|uniref:phosphoethanolamine transferase n=1 Tax=Planctobacterium marinum TaxID=1631968 RepID=UPI001E5D44B9|nr:phosphoethanolamine--lipid A transferase [Planctobacterium marinum]MCC2605316.1 phosphoethanolamine--lipid A transferase [Planctobacterium marinum]